MEQHELKGLLKKNIEDLQATAKAMESRYQVLEAIDERNEDQEDEHTWLEESLAALDNTIQELDNCF